MEIIYNLKYHQKVIDDDIPALNGAWKKKIKKSIEQKLSTDPTLYGKPLRRDLHGCYKLRVGDYRVIYNIKKNIVYVLVIKHQREVYKSKIDNRL